MVTTVEPVPVGTAEPRPIGGPAEKCPKILRFKPHTRQNLLAISKDVALRERLGREIGIDTDVPRQPRKETPEERSKSGILVMPE
jgi:hypothetical protein